MARWLFTIRGRYSVTHLVTGHADEFVSDCGVHFSRFKNTTKTAKRIRAHPSRVTDRRAIWDHPYPGVTCKHCIRQGTQDFFRKKPSTEPESPEEARWTLEST